ncbi:MAG: thioredoxin fold domain-containing protein [Actinobacteria bacterium]|nr:thioredoxin fold domain-containing protein [Actinomycetota bacterium]
MKKILSITAIALVVTVATFLVYQFMFIQRPARVLAEIGEAVGAVRSGEANFSLVVYADGIRVLDESGSAKWSGKPEDVAGFIDAKSNDTLGPDDRAFFDVTVKTPERQRTVLKTQIGDTVYLKDANSGEKWIKYPQNEVIEAATEFPGWRYANALLKATDYLEDYKDAKELTRVTVDERKLTQVRLGLKRKEWLAALASKTLNDSEYGLEDAAVESLVWIDPATSLPVKTEVKLTITKAQNVSCVFTMDYTGFNQNHQITAPPADQVFTEEEFARFSDFARDLADAERNVEHRAYGKALTTLTRLERNEPNNVRVLELMAIAYLGARDAREAALYIEKVLSYNTNSSDAYRVKSDLRLREANALKSDIVRRAVSEVESTATFVARPDVDWTDEVAFERPTVLSEATYQDAVALLSEDYREELDSLNPMFWEALRHALKATRLNPLSADARISLGCAYLELGNEASAADSFERAIEIKPALTESDFMRGLMYYARANPVKGARLIKKAAYADVDGRYEEVAKALFRHISEGKIPETPEDILRGLASSSSVQRLDTALADQGRPILLMFFSDDCAVSREIADDINAIKDRYASDIEFIAVDIDSGEADITRLLATYKFQVTPALFMMSASGQRLHEHDGYIDTKVLEQWIKNAIPRQ